MNKVNVINTTNLTITAQTAWDTWYGFSERACNDTAIVYRWYCQAFFSGAANQRYRNIGVVIGSLMVLSLIAGKLARIYLQKWVDETVEQALVTTEVEETPVATFLPPLTQRLESLKGPQLRRLCVVKGIEYRNFNGPKRNMKVAQMREALVTALMDQ